MPLGYPARSSVPAAVQTTFEHVVSRCSRSRRAVRTHIKATAWCENRQNMDFMLSTARCKQHYFFHEDGLLGIIRCMLMVRNTHTYGLRGHFYTFLFLACGFLQVSHSIASVLNMKDNFTGMAASQEKRSCRWLDGALINSIQAMRKELGRSLYLQTLSQSYSTSVVILLDGGCLPKLVSQRHLKMPARGPSTQPHDIFKYVTLSIVASVRS